jgi:hypothetical protein
MSKRTHRMSKEQQQGMRSKKGRGHFCKQMKRKERKERKEKGERSEAINRKLLIESY